MKNFKKIIIGSILGILALPISAFASPSSVDRITDHIEPLIKADYIKGNYFVATGTTPSVFPNASTTAFSAQVICFTLDTCRTTWPSGSGGSAFPFTVTSYGVSTSTTVGFLNGLLSNSSTTLSGTFRLPSLANGELSVFGGTVSSGATTTAGTGLTYSGNAFNVNTSQNISQLSNLTSNGFVKTGSGNGTLSVDTTSYVPTTRTLTINGVALDLSADRSWTVSGGSGGVGTWSTTTSQVPGRFINYSNNASDIVVIGSTATSTPATNKIWFDPNTDTIGVGSGSAWLYNGGQIIYPTDANHSVLTDALLNLYVRNGLKDSTNSVGASSTALLSNGTKTFWQKLSTSQLTNDSGFITSTSIPPYIFPQTGNGTSTLTQFNAGLTSFASSTIGNGTQTGGLTINGRATTSDMVFIPQSSPTYSQGKLTYDNPNQSLTFYNADANTSLQIGQEEWILVFNNTGSTITNGSAVYISGSNGLIGTVGLADASNASKTIAIGLATEDIANNATGTVTTMGLVNGINTSGFTAGATLFLSTTTPGGLVPYAGKSPNYRYRVGFVSKVNATTGSIHVTPSTAGIGNGNNGDVLYTNFSGSQAFIATSSLGLQSPITLTTTGTNGAATLIANVLNIPNYTSSGSAYPFSLAGNATSTLTQFNGGLTAFASSTIGNGNSNGGLTVNGTATSTRVVTTSVTATSTFVGPVWADLQSGAIPSNAWFGVGSSLTNPPFEVTQQGTVGIGTSSPMTPFAVQESTSTFVGDVVVGISSTQAFKVDYNGNVGVGTSSPWRGFSINGTMAAPNVTVGTGNNLCLKTGGEVVNAGNTNCSTSSKWTKHDVNSIPDDEVIALVNALNPVMFTYNDGGTEHMGFIAEEVDSLSKQPGMEDAKRFVEYAQTDIPETQTDGSIHIIKKGEPYSLDYNGFSALLVRYVQLKSATVDSSASNYTQWVLIALLAIGLIISFKRKQ